MRIGMELGQYQKQTTSLILAPRMIQSMEILQLPIMSLVERIQAELQENPVLELREAAGDEPAGLEEFKGTDSLPPEKESDPERDELVIDEDKGELDFDRLEALSRDYEDVINEEHRPSRNGVSEEDDKKHDAMQNMAARPASLQDYLNEQLAFLDASPELARLARHVISYVDHTGYLGLRVTRKKDPAKGDDEDNLTEAFVPVTAEEIIRTYDRPVSEDEVEEAILLVQKLDPPGVGARDLRECLLSQVTPDTPHADVVLTLIKDHLEDIQHNRLPVIQKKTGYDLPTIQEGIEVLRHLNPRPGSLFAPDTNRYVVPDIAIEQREDGTYQIRLLDDWVPDVYISRRYVEMCKDRSSDPKTREFLKRKIQDAQWLKDSIEQRRNTLEKVTRAIIEHQRPFLDQGPEHIQPLKMQQIADQVHVHVTTVSRAVDDKYVQTPRGVFPLKRFFGGASKNEETGEEIAWERIKQHLLELIEKEDKTNPLSDEELVERL
ncbi:MAG TPA: RNA polymerase factor sigma-54, partial [Gemmataceae bacterium]|nr:RNA polymerase factor sigma-54 [Gemmataceae bacterium]